MTAALALAQHDDSAAIVACREVLQAKSKSFALAAKLLPASCRDPVAVLYAWCRHVDDAIDLVPHGQRATALATLRAELDGIYQGTPPEDPTLAAFSVVVRRHAIPRAYTEALLDGMAMDVERRSYRTLPELLLYCHRVAGVVGLMMCHVMGISDAGATRRAAHLGIAMQLTNICRDVDEDQRDGRVYLPAELLGGDLSAVPRVRVQTAVSTLLREAEGFYRSADAGISALPFRCGLAVHAARLVYSAIGDRLAAVSYDPYVGRAYVPAAQKARLVLIAFARAVRELPTRLRRLARYEPPLVTLRFPDDVLPR